MNRRGSGFRYGKKDYRPRKNREKNNERVREIEKVIWNERDSNTERERGRNRKRKIERERASEREREF